MLNELGKFFIILGIISIAIGITFIFVYKFSGSPEPLKLPGDIIIKKGSITFYFPIVTCIIISIILTFLLNIFFRK
jgi:heme/copper-type cytochrome/quinol oxidase subunit 2